MPSIPLCRLKYIPKVKPQDKRRSWFQKMYSGKQAREMQKVPSDATTVPLYRADQGYSRKEENKTRHWIHTP